MMVYCCFYGYGYLTMMMMMVACRWHDVGGAVDFGVEVRLSVAGFVRLEPLAVDVEFF